MLLALVYSLLVVQHPRELHGRFLRDEPALDELMQHVDVDIPFN